MSEPRYIVTSLSGYPITPSTADNAYNGKLGTEWYVLDTAYCHKVVAMFNARNAKGRAKVHCLALNREEWAWEAREALRERRRHAASLRERIKGRFA